MPFERFVSAIDQNILTLTEEFVNRVILGEKNPELCDIRSRLLIDNSRIGWSTEILRHERTINIHVTEHQFRKQKHGGEHLDRWKIVSCCTLISCSVGIIFHSLRCREYKGRRTLCNSQPSLSGEQEEKIEDEHCWFLYLMGWIPGVSIELWEETTRSDLFLRFAQVTWCSAPEERERIDL